MPFDLPSPSLPSFGLGQHRSALRAPLSPDQEQGIGKSLLGQAQGALSYTLGSLNKPGRAVRGMLAGKWHEGLAALPFSDSLGITNPDNEVTGKKLLQHHGLLRPGDNSWGAWGAGLATDIATDPLTYATFGAKHALTTGGRALEATGALKGWGRRSLLEGYNGTETAARAAGNSASDIAHMADQGRRFASPAAESAYAKATGQQLRGGEALSGLARFSIPFRSDMGFTLGTGRLSQAAAGGLDAAGDWLRYGNPIGRTIGANLNTAVHRATDANTQRGWANDGHQVFTDLNRQARVNQYDVSSPLDHLIRANPQHESQILRAARINTEGTSPLAYLAGGGDRSYLNATRPLGNQVAGYGSTQLMSERNAGLLTNNLQDKFARFVSRQATSAGDAGAQMERRTILPTSSGTNIHREEMFRDLPGGTDRINDLASRFSGDPNSRLSTARIFRDTVADHASVVGVAPTHTEKAAYLAKAHELSGYFGKLDRDKYLGKINENPFFSHDLSGDVLRRGEQHARTMGASSAAVSSLAQAARPVTALGAGQHVPLNRALEQLGLGNHDLGPELVGAGKDLYRRLAPKGAGKVDPLVSGGTPYGLDQELAKYGVSQKEFEQISKPYAGWQAPEEVKNSVGLYDSSTNAFKALTYPIWLASHVRNAATAGLNGLRLGTTSGDYAKQFQLMRGQLPAAEADAMRRLQFGHANIFGGGGGALELQGTTATAKGLSPRKWQDYTPGTNGYGMGRVGPTGSFAGDAANLIGKEGMLDLASGVGRGIKNVPSRVSSAIKSPEMQNLLASPSMAHLGEAYRAGKSALGEAYRSGPFAIAGVGSTQVDRFAPVAAGRKLSGNIEDFMRGAQFQGLLRQGHSPGEAADLINRFHFDYSKHGTTQFENNVMKRISTFYRFPRGNLPLQMETLATRPGAFSSPFAPTRVDRDQQQYTPDYLAAGFAAPLGKEVNGQQRFLSSLGLPQEEALKEMSLWNGKPDLTSTAMRFAGNLNPMIKGPLEQIADRQFYSGRKLSDLRPSLTATSLASHFSDDYSQPLSQLISNTPLTRFATSLDKLMDTKGLASSGRKPGWATALNLGTGARITDVDLEKQRYLEQRAALDSMLKGQPHVDRYTQYYVRPENKGQLTPDETLQLRKLTEMQAQGRKHEQQRRLRVGVRQ